MLEASTDDSLANDEDASFEIAEESEEEVPFEVASLEQPAKERTSNEASKQICFFMFLSFRPRPAYECLKEQGARFRAPNKSIE